MPSGYFWKFFSDHPEIEWKRKDPQRLFDWPQKLAIYRRQNGRCLACKREVDITRAVFHHRMPWEKGGKTTVENGEMYHSEHHPRA